MYKVFEILLVIMSMICLIIEKSSCYQILVIGLLFGIMFAIEKKSKGNKDE